MLVKDAQAHKPDSDGVYLIKTNIVQVQEQLDAPGQTSRRRIGYDFARIGLPKWSFGSLFATLIDFCPGLDAKVKCTAGYLCVNASWGE